MVISDPCCKRALVLELIDTAIFILVCRQLLLLIRAHTNTIQIEVIMRYQASPLGESH